MTLFARLRESSALLEVGVNALDGTTAGPFSLKLAEKSAEITFAPPWSAGPPQLLWSYAFESPEVLRRFLANAGVRDGSVNPMLVAFWGRRLVAFGPGSLDAQAGSAEASVQAEREQEEARRVEEERRRRTVDLYATEKGGWYQLELKRESEDRADWRIRFRGRAERERLLDYLRWRRPWFGGYLDHAAEHGDRALEKRLTAEMFEMERTVKASGRGAGGSRPLRMWRGEP